MLQNGRVLETGFEIRMDEASCPKSINWSHWEMVKAKWMSTGFQNFQNWEKKLTTLKIWYVN